MCVIFGDFEGETATTRDYILNLCAFTQSPPPELVFKLLLPPHPKLNSCSTFFWAQNLTILNLYNSVCVLGRFFYG